MKVSIKRGYSVVFKYGQSPDWRYGTVVEWNKAKGTITVKDHNRNGAFRQLSVAKIKLMGFWSPRHAKTHRRLLPQASV